MSDNAWIEVFLTVQAVILVFNAYLCCGLFWMVSHAKWKYQAMERMYEDIFDKADEVTQVVLWMSQNHKDPFPRARKEDVK